MLMQWYKKMQCIKATAGKDLSNIITEVSL